MRVTSRPERQKKRRGKKADRDNYGELTPLWWRRQCEGAITVSWGRWLKSLPVSGEKSWSFRVLSCMCTDGNTGYDHAWLWTLVSVEAALFQDFCSFFFFFVVVVVSTSLSLLGKSGHLSQVRYSSRKSSATHSYQCVLYFLLTRISACCIFYSLVSVRAVFSTRSYQCVLYFLLTRISACCIFVCPNNAMAASAWDFLTCAQMLMHVSAHGGLYGNCKSLHWRLTLGKNSLAASGTWTSVSTVASFSDRCCTNWALPHLCLSVSKAKVSKASRKFQTETERGLKLQRRAAQKQQADCSCCWLLLYSVILSLHSHEILHEWTAFYSAFMNIYWSGVLTALVWLVPHETAAISARSVYTIRVTTMLHVTSCKKATYVRYMRV